LAALGEIGCTIFKTSKEKLETLHASCMRGLLGSLVKAEMHSRSDNLCPCTCQSKTKVARHGSSSYVTTIWRSSYIGTSFAVVEQLDRGLCVEEAGRLPTIMTTTTGQTKVATTSSSKGQGNTGSSKRIAMVAEVEATSNTHMRCWTCGELGHGKKGCPNSKPSDGKNGGQSKTSGNATNSGQRSKPQGQGKATHSPSKCTHPSCGRIGHTEAQCWIKNPQLRPQSFQPQGSGSTSGTNSLEARMGELQNSLALLLAATTKQAPATAESKPAYVASQHPGYDRFE